MRASLGLTLARTILFCGTALGETYLYTQKPTPSTATEKQEKVKPAKHVTAEGNQEEEGKDPSSIPPKPTTTIKEAVSQLLHKEEGALFPKGTKVIGTSLKGELATLDFNEAFKAIETLGESTESEAQKALIGVLVRFPSVKTARVLVEGKPYTSGAFDWSEPFTVQ